MNHNRPKNLRGARAGTEYLSYRKRYLGIAP